MNALALDTATPYLVLGTLHSERTLRRGRAHAETLVGDLEDFLAWSGVKPAELDLVVVGEGPGSYTGLRVGLAAATALAHAWNLPLVGVPTLAAVPTPPQGAQVVWPSRNRFAYVLDRPGAPARKEALEAWADTGCRMWAAPPSGRRLAQLGLEAWRAGREGAEPRYL
ncbi:tRNA (adenosine(37)-N6)-threonylcarbamoyltransferase complex dimerization subunit type 1 TsaB [Oceanithermus sp.]